MKIISTGDGSHSLIHEQLDETYHSRHGAIQESVHVFIKNGLQFWIDQHGKEEITILEIGFGTGLNALLALQFSLTHHVKIHFTTLEAFPVAKELTSILNYSDQLGFERASEFFRALHAASWNQPVSITPDFTIEKREGKLQKMELQTAQYDVIFFDAFAPNKQPEMWEISTLKKVTDTMKPSSVFVTYCAKGQLKRDLKSLGLIVESLPGPPGKREMVRALR